jgi:type VI protein secretion system component Hcp
VDFSCAGYEPEKKESRDDGLDFVIKKPEDTTVNLTKRLDTASGTLMFMALQDKYTGKSKQDSTVKAEIHFVEQRGHATGDTAGQFIAFLRIAMDNVRIQSWNVTGSGDERPTESLTLSCEKIAIRTNLSEDGKTYRTGDIWGWDQTKKGTTDRKWTAGDFTDYFQCDSYP